MNNNLVSVITPLYNSELYIERTIQSVLNQTYENWEMLIIDDCSTDNGYKLVQEIAFKDSRIKLLKNDVNSGAAIARNKGIKAAQGKYIAFLDSDDQWHADKLRIQVSYMQENNISFSFSYYDQVNEYGETIGVINNLPKKVNYKSTIRSNKIGCLTAMYNANQLGKVYMAEIRKRQDYTLWLALLKKTDYAYCVPEVLGTYTIREGSISSNRFDLIKYHWHIYRVIEKHTFFNSVYYLGYWMTSKLFGGSSR